MANCHVKTINGRKYYYESVRKGKKITSRYIGPVEEPIKMRKKEIREEDLVLPEDCYIG